MQLINNFCWWLVNKYPHRVRIIKRNDKPYLLRFYLTTNRAEDKMREEPELFGLYLHYFFTGDEDPDLHNHPWLWALSFILSGTYIEERTNGFFLRKAGRFNYISHQTFHRVSMDGGKTPVWTLFTVGSRITSWGFLNKETGQFWDHKDYFKKRDAHLQQLGS